MEICSFLLVLVCFLFFGVYGDWLGENLGLGWQVYLSWSAGSLPAISLELPVIDQWSYESLRLAPCRYSGSAYTHNLVILGHNYAGHFRELKKLQPGDAVTFTDMDGNVFSYEVMALETLAPTAVEEMTEGDWDLTLFTCTVGGTTRLAVRCEALDALPARYAEE